MGIHEKILNFQRYSKIFRFSKLTFYQVQMWDSSLFIIPNSDVRFKSLSFALKCFNEKISNFQSWLFSQFSCEIQVIMPSIMGFHEKYRIFKVDSFPSSDVRFKSLIYAFMGFHEKYCFFKVHILPSSDVRFKS